MSTPSSTTSATPTPTPTHDNHDSNSGPTSSPLLFFVALGFGVVFTNLWIIVGVKYCFRYNQRNRAGRALNENGEPIDLTQMPRPHRRRREKKLMSMEEVNERFPLMKYKTWRSTREAEGLPAAGGVTAPPSRAASLKGVEADEGTIDGGNRRSVDSNRPTTALGIAQQDHAYAASAARPQTPDAAEGAAHQEGTPDRSSEKANVERTTTASTDNTYDTARQASVMTVDDEDEDDPIRTAAPPDMLAAPGDSCAICLDTLEDEDDVRGLTCGHAFHAACVDPWLTSRRACCPLCKADYYIPKPRPDGSEDPATQPAAARGRIRGINLPQAPPPTWIGARGGMAFRPRLLMAGPRFFFNAPADDAYNASPTTQERRRRQQDAMYRDPASERQQQRQSNGGGWRSRLPAAPSVRLPRFGRRNQQLNSEEGTTGNTTTVTTSPRDLEAGNRQ